MAYDTNATLTLELDFALSGDFRPGREAKMPSFRDEVGSPAEPDETEWRVERIGIPYRHELPASTLRTPSGDVPAKRYEWRTRWLTLDATTLKAINEALSADAGFDESACDAIREAAT